MAFPSQPSNQKWCACLAKTPGNRHKISMMSMLCWFVLIGTTLTWPMRASEPATPFERVDNPLAATTTASALLCYGDDTQYAVAIFPEEGPT
jgi:hypothetical protein